MKNKEIINNIIKIIFKNKIKIFSSSVKGFYLGFY